MRFSTSYYDLCKTVTLAGTHWLQRCWLAYDSVFDSQGLFVSQSLGTQTTNLFVCRENHRKWAFEIFEINTLNGSKRRGYKALRVARPSSVEFPITLG